MPSAQVIDINPNPRTELTPLEKTLNQFSQRHVENQRQAQESTALEDIYKKYQQEGTNISDHLFNINKDARLSPTTKVQLANQAVQMQKINGQLQKEAQQNLEKEKESESVLGALEKERGLAPGTLSPYKSDIKLAEQISRPQKESKQNQADRPIDEDQLARIEHVRSKPEYAKASGPEKYRMLTAAGVSQANSKSEADIATAQEKVDAAKEKAQKAEEHLYHKETEKFDEEINKNASGAKNQLSAIKDSRKALDKGASQPASLANIFRSFGSIGQTISNALLTEDQAVLQASIPAFLEGRKELFGVRLSDADLKLLQDKLPDIGKSKEANTAILNIMERAANASILKQKIASEIKKNNKGLRGIDFRDQVNEKFDELMLPVQIITPRGHEVEIPTYQLSDALISGAKVKNE